MTDGVVVGVGDAVSVTVTVTGDGEDDSVTVFTDGSGGDELEDPPATLTTEYGALLRRILSLISFGTAREKPRVGRTSRRAVDGRCMAEGSLSVSLLFEGSEVV